jgi:hypothetical protein
MIQWKLPNECDVGSLNFMVTTTKDTKSHEGSITNLSFVTLVSRVVLF